MVKNNSPKKKNITANVKDIQETKEIKEINEYPKSNAQQFKVYSIVSDSAVIAKGIEDGKWYSKPNKNYNIGDIID